MEPENIYWLIEIKDLLTQYIFPFLISTMTAVVPASSSLIFSSGGGTKN